MTTVISGVFQRAEQARQALVDLHGAGFATDCTTDIRAKDGVPARDRAHQGGHGQPADDDPAVGGAMSGALIGTAVGTTVGLASPPVLGPAAVIAGGGVGAYVGSLYGALGQLGEAETSSTADANAGSTPGAQESPTQVAVSAHESSEQQAVIRILREHGATGIHHQEGTRVDRRWIDRTG